MTGRAVRVAAGWSFLVSGMVLASWFVRIPDLRAELHLSDSDLGLASFAIAAGGIAGMQAAAPLIGRFGSGPVLRLVTVLLPFLLVPAAMANGFVPLLAWLLLLGIGVGLMDVAMNTHGTTVERAQERPVLNALHGAWSVGGIAASASAGALAGAGVSLVHHFTVMAVVLAAVSAVLIRAMLPGTADRRATPSADAGTGRRWFEGWSPATVRFGLLVLCCLLTEGALANWSAVFVNERHSVSPGVAALAYLAFSVMMALGRIVGNRLARSWQPAQLVRAGAILAATGLTAALLLPSAAGSVAAFGLCGAGLSVVVPTVFSAVGRYAARQPSGVESSMARVTTLGYVGVLGGPVIIGAVAHGAGLAVALALPTALLLIVAAAARTVSVTEAGAGADRVAVGETEAPRT